MNALANPEVGKYLNEYFVCSFQKVATFRIVGGQKQGGNVASYFCAPTAECCTSSPAPWTLPRCCMKPSGSWRPREKAMDDAKGDGAKFKAYFRTAHAERLKNEHGLTVEPVTFDPPADQDPNSALTYNDPTGRPLAPKLPPPPVDGPDVTIKPAMAAQLREAKADGARMLLDRTRRPLATRQSGPRRDAPGRPRHEQNRNPLRNDL